MLATAFPFNLHNLLCFPGLLLVKLPTPLLSQLLVATELYVQAGLLLTHLPAELPSPSIY